MNLFVPMGCSVAPQPAVTVVAEAGAVFCEGFAPWAAVGGKHAPGEFARSPTGTPADGAPGRAVPTGLCAFEPFY